MTCRRFLKLLPRLVDRAAPDPRGAREHLAACPSCREAYEATATAVGGLHSVQPPTDSSSAERALAAVLRDLRAPQRKEEEMSAVSGASAQAGAGARKRARRGPRLRWAAVPALVVLACLGGAFAGYWYSQRYVGVTIAGGTETVALNPERLYEQAQRAYVAGRAPEAVAAIEKALRGQLALAPILDQSTNMRLMALLRDVARKSRDYSLALAARGDRAGALRVCDLIHGMAGQLGDARNASLLSGLVGVAIYKLEGDTRAQALRALRDPAAAQVQESLNRQRAAQYERTVKPRILEAARQGGIGSEGEGRLAREIDAIWR